MKNDYYVVFPNGGMYRQCYGPFGEQQAFDFVEEEKEPNEEVAITKVVKSFDKE